MAEQKLTTHEKHEEAEEAWAERWPWLLPLAAGIFLGAAAFEMIPEALENAGTIGGTGCHHHGWRSASRLKNLSGSYDDEFYE
jgi:hypothetical protein